MPVIAVVGDTGSGKTLLCEQLVLALSAAGVRVGYVKHAPHGFEPGRPESDSERALAAGADPAVVLGRDGLLQLSVGAGTPADHLAQLLAGLRGDVILLEGFGSGPWPKIRVALHGTEPREVAEPVLLDLTRPADASFADADVARALEVLGSQGRLAGSSERATLHADGREIPLRGFARTMIASTVRGLTAPLRGVENADRLVIEVERRTPA